MATHTNTNRYTKTMPKWVTETNDRIGPKPPPPPSPSTPDSGYRAPVLPPKSKNLPEPDYEVIEFSGQQYSNEVLKSGSRSKTPSTPDTKLKCTLCGSHNPWVTCEECSQQIFCASCDDMFHKHPKRRAHMRKAIEPSRPPLPPKILPGQNGPTPPVAPPRRKGRGFCTPLLQRKEQVNNGNTLPIPSSPTPSMKSSSWQERVNSLKSGLHLNLSNRPLPETPKTPTSEHTSSRSVTPRSVFDSIQRPPSVTLEKIKSKASATLDKMALLQQRYRQHKEESQRGGNNTERSGSVTDQNLSFDQWSNISPSPSHFRSGSMSSGINSSHFDLTDDTHFHNLFNQRQMRNAAAMQQHQQQQRANSQMGNTRGMSTSVFNLNRRTAEPQSAWMNNQMQQAQSMAQLNCATCANPQANAWHPHSHQNAVNGPNGEWGGQFTSQHQLNRSNLSLNVGAGYMLPHHHGAGGMMAPPPVFMNQAGMMGGMYPYPYNAGMPIMNPGVMGMPPPTRSRATSRAVSPAMSRKSMQVRRKQRPSSYVDDELTDDEDSDQDERRSIISNRSNMTNTLRARQRRISSASQLLDDDGDTQQQRHTRTRMRDRRGSVAKSVQSDWLPSQRQPMNHTNSNASTQRQNEPGFVNNMKPTRIYSDLDSESSGTRALVQAKIQEKLEKSKKRSSSRDSVGEAARQKPSKVSTEVQAGGSRPITKSMGGGEVVGAEKAVAAKEVSTNYEANKGESEEEEATVSEESGSEETESEAEEEEQENTNAAPAASTSTQAQDVGGIEEDDLGPPPSTPDHEWECEFCTYVNEPNTKICLICCKTPSAGARKPTTAQAPAGSAANESTLQAKSTTTKPSVSPERATTSKERPTNNAERTKDKSKDKIKEKSKDKVTSSATTATATGTSAIPKRKSGMTQSIISNLTNGMSKLKLASSSTTESDAKKKESVEDVWAALDDNIQTTANEVMRKAEQQTKQGAKTKISTSCGTTPSREVKQPLNVRTPQVVQRNVKETGTSPPPQSISTQTYDTLQLKQPEPRLVKPMEVSGLLYSESAQLRRDAHSPMSICSPDMPHYEPRHKEPETELYILLKEAELYKFTPEELHAALKYCGTATHPVQWLRDNWHKLIQTVQSLSTKYGQERAENTIGTISQNEAREALRQHGGNIWQAVSECIEQRQRKYRDILSKGNFSREDIVTALTIHQGNAELAIMDLGRTQLKPFLMRIRGSPAGVENESGASLLVNKATNEHTIEPEIHEFLSANALECFQAPNAAGLAFITDHSSTSSLHETSTNELRVEDIYRYNSPFNREPSASSFHLDDPTFNNNQNMLKDLETLIGNIEQNQSKPNEPLLKMMETILGDSLGKRESELENENDPEMMRILMKSPISKHSATDVTKSSSEDQLDVKNFVWQHIQEIVPNLVQQVEMELMEEDLVSSAVEASAARKEVLAPKVQPPEPPPINAEEFLLEEIIGPNIKEASIHELVPPEFVYAAEIANFRIEFDRALDREHEQEFEYENLKEAERKVYKMFEAPQSEKAGDEKEDVAKSTAAEAGAAGQVKAENIIAMEIFVGEINEKDETRAEAITSLSKEARQPQMLDENQPTAPVDSMLQNIPLPETTASLKTGPLMKEIVSASTGGVETNISMPKTIEVPVVSNEIHSSEKLIATGDKTVANHIQSSLLHGLRQEMVKIANVGNDSLESFSATLEGSENSNTKGRESLTANAVPLEATLVRQGEFQSPEKSIDNTKRRRNEKGKRRQNRGQQPKYIDKIDIKTGKDVQRTESKERTETKDRSADRRDSSSNLKINEESEDQGDKQQEIVHIQPVTKARSEDPSVGQIKSPEAQVEDVDNSKSNDPTVKGRQSPKVSRIPIRRSASRNSGEPKKPNQLTAVETKLTNNENKVPATNNERYILEEEQTDVDSRRVNGQAEERTEEAAGEPMQQMGIQNEKVIENAGEGEIQAGVIAEESKAQGMLETSLDVKSGGLYINSEDSAHEPDSTAAQNTLHMHTQELYEDGVDEVTASADLQGQERQTEVNLRMENELKVHPIINTGASIPQAAELPSLTAETEPTTESNTNSVVENLQSRERDTDSASESSKFSEAQSFQYNVEPVSAVDTDNGSQGGPHGEKAFSEEASATTAAAAGSEEAGQQSKQIQALKSYQPQKESLQITDELIPVQDPTKTMASSQERDHSSQVWESEESAEVDSNFDGAPQQTIKERDSQDAAEGALVDVEVPSTQHTAEEKAQGDVAVPSRSTETNCLDVSSTEEAAETLTPDLDKQSLNKAPIEMTHHEDMAALMAASTDTVIEAPITQTIPVPPSENGREIYNHEPQTNEVFQDAADLSADEEDTNNEKSTGMVENQDNDATSDDELYSIESELSDHEHAHSLILENEQRNGNETQVPLEKSTSDTAIDASLSKKSRQRAAVEFVFSPDASKQNLSELVEDTQRLIKQMRDEINIEDFESSEEDYTDDYTDEDDYEEEDGEGEDWDEDDTEYDGTSLSEGVTDEEEDFFDEQDEEGLSGEDEAVSEEVKISEAVTNGLVEENESAKELEEHASTPAEEEQNRSEESSTNEQADTESSIISPLGHSETILTTEPSSSKATDMHAKVSNALQTKNDTQVELISITNANNPTTYANRIENVSTEVESEQKTPEVSKENVIPKEADKTLAESLTGNHREELRVESGSEIEATSVQITVPTKDNPPKEDERPTTTSDSISNSGTSKSRDSRTPVSSKTGVVSKIPQIRSDVNEASTSKAARSPSANRTSNEKATAPKTSNAMTTKTTISNANTTTEQIKPKESKIPKQTPKKVPLRSKSFSGPPGPIGISSVKTIQQKFLSQQKQLTTRLEPPKNPPTIVRKKSITEAITKFTPNTSSIAAKGAAAASTGAKAAASIFRRTQPRIPKKKYHETCFSDDDFESTSSEEEPEPMEIRQRKQSVPVFRAYPSVQEPEAVPTEVLVQKLVEEKLVATVAEAQIAATLINMKFQQDVSIWAAKECSDLEQAISMLQQECELCMGTYPMNQIVSMLKCTHKCCKQCAQTYFTVQITDRSINDCTCPFCKLPELHGHNEHEDENLEYFSNLDIFLKSILDNEVHELFQRKLRDRTLLQDPNFKWCIQCSSGFFARPRQKRLICPDCGSVTCAQCRKTWEKQHEGISCDQYKEWKEANDPELQAQGVQEHLAHNGIDCPKCKFRYSLARGGCMHFTCTQCKYEFCYGCGKPFMMGAKCTISSYCAKLGLHAHHPRNCLFYLRDKLPIQLQMLLKENNVAYDEENKELTSVIEDKPSTSAASKVPLCPIPLQKETPTGLVDTVCNGDVPDRHAGMCRTHYVEYLSAKVAKARIDPLPIFDLTDCVQELRRRDIKLPERGPWDTDEIYKGMCSEIIKKNIPLETNYTT